MIWGGCSKPFLVCVLKPVHGAWVQPSHLWLGVHRLAAVLLEIPIHPWLVVHRLAAVLLETPTHPWLVVRQLAAVLLETLAHPAIGAELGSSSSWV